MNWLWIVLFSGSSALADPVPAVTTPVASPVENPLRNLALTGLDGSPLDRTVLDGARAVLFVNVASRCGYTRQYEGLQALHEAKKDEGLVIIGVPCNQFGGQEPGTAAEIQSFCRLNYGVSFPLLEKQEVNGSSRSPLYQWLVKSEAGAGSDVGWNFEKFLVDGRSGTVVGRFKSSVDPSDSSLVTAIDQLLTAS